MAEEAPVKLIQIGPKGGTKKDGFNLVTERVVAVNPEAKQLEVELLAYDGKTVVLDVGDEAFEDFLKIKPGDGATIRVVEEGGKRIAKSFRIQGERSERGQSRCHVDRPQGFPLAQPQVCGGSVGRIERSTRRCATSGSPER
jgi:hypothetical protein